MNWSGLVIQKPWAIAGVDPAEMETEVLENPNFTHIRRRGNEVRKKDLRSVRWLMADVNAAPTYTLNTIEEMVTSSSAVSAVNYGGDHRATSPNEQ